MDQDERQDGWASGFVCPQCGGLVNEVQGREVPRFECRIGDSFSAAELWIEHCAARNAALKRAQRALTENAALALRLAEWTRSRGNQPATIRLEQEASEDQRLAVQLTRMLEGLPPPDERAVTDLEQP
jgi:two-component system chemotaxis response regulator CheB